MAAHPPRRAAPGRPRPLTRTAVVLTAVVGLLLAAIGSAAAGPSRASYARPVTATFLTTAGTFTLTGTVNIVLPPNPIAPSNAVIPSPPPIRATLEHTAASNGDLTCRATGTASHQPAPGETSVDFTGTYGFQPGDPCDPLGDLRVAYAITYDEAGNPITVQAEVVDGEIVT